MLFDAVEASEMKSSCHTELHKPHFDRLKFRYFMGFVPGDPTGGIP